MSLHWTPAKSVLATGVDGLSLADLDDESTAVASKLEDRSNDARPLVQPITHSSTYKIKSVEHYEDILKNGGYIYSRLGTPTSEAVECTLTDLEGGAGSLVFSSGMAASTTALTYCLKSGDHIVCVNPVYSGVHFFINKYMVDLNVSVTWVPAGCGAEEYRKAIKPNTKLLYAETPGNPILSIQDLAEIAKLGQEKNILTMVDSTFASPYLQKPISLGIDIVMHSATKYLSGHSDLVAGSLTVKTEDMWKKLMVYRTTLGNNLSPFDASLLLRGIKTLHIRVNKHCENAMKVAEFLAKQPKIEIVHYPGLKDHPGHEVAKKHMKMFGGMVTFEMKGGLKAASALVEGVKLIQLAVSLGGVESLIEHPASMTHGSMVMTEEERLETLITPGLIRLSVGIENDADLIKDLQQALDRV